MLTFSAKNIKERFDRMPMALLTLALIGGIMLAAHFTVHYGLWIILVVLSTLVALWRREAALAALFALGGALYQINALELLPQNEPLRLVVQIDDRGIDYGKFSTYDADVHSCNGRRVRAKVRITADSLVHPRQGDIIEIDTS